MTRAKFAGRLACALVLCATSAFGQNEAARTTAREIGKEGLQAFDRGDYRTAADKLLQAYQIVRVPTLATYRARALAKLGMYLEACELYLEASRLDASEGDVAAQKQAQSEAVAERAALLPRLAKVSIQIQGADPNAAEVWVDDQRIPPVLFQPGQLVNPGTHQVVARIGANQATQVVTLAEAQQRIVTLAFGAQLGQSNPAGATVSPLQEGSAGGSTTGRTLGWIGIGVGSAGVALGAVTGVLALSKRSNLQDSGCSGNHCYLDQQGAVDSYQTMRTLSTVGFVVGVAGLATGTVLLVTNKPKPHREVVLAPAVGLGSVAIAGRF